jgi:hypothetical protein
MSSFHTTSITINTKAGTVHLTGYESNVFPKKACRFESSYLSDMLKEQGPEAVDAYLLEQFQGGMMKGGDNDYNNTLKLYGSATLENLQKLRELKTLNRGKKFSISCGIGYLVSITSRRYKTSPDISRALVFNYIQAALKAKLVNGELIEFTAVNKREVKC